jgi:DNA relaxase NicK
MTCIFDYVVITIKEDIKSGYRRELELEDVLKLTGLTEHFSDFQDGGAKMNYARMYFYNNIRIYESSMEKRQEMGFCVEMSGEGCRYYESLMGIGFTWKSFFKKFYDQIGYGCALNICRIDLAYDDFVGALKMKKVRKSIIKGKCISLFRKGRSVSAIVPECVISEQIKGKGRGQSIYMGNRKSNASCKFYDKLEEQKQKHIKNEEKLNELKQLRHWVRFEITYRNNSAIKLINAMMYMNEDAFMKYAGEYVNSYIRFIDKTPEEGENVTRISMAGWWARFMGSAERATLKTIPLKKSPLKSALRSISYSWSKTIMAVINNIGEDAFLSLVRENASPDYWKKKHWDIAYDDMRDYSEHDNLSLWRSLRTNDLMLYCYDGERWVDKLCLTLQ